MGLKWNPKGVANESNSDKKLDQSSYGTGETSTFGAAYNTISPKVFNMPPKTKRKSKGPTPSINLSKRSHPTRRSKRLIAIANNASIASKLPFDILFQIFEDYAVTETITTPLETILLVCRSWNQAALSHPRLWSSFKIRCGDLWYWVSCIPRRLSRCPPDSLLDIELDMAGDMTIDGRRSRCNELDFKLYQEAVLSLLAGPHGELAFRWRTLQVIEIGFNGEVSSLASFLVYPTPNIQELELEGLVSLSPIFPSTPSLRIFSAFNVVIPTLPNLSSAVEVSIGTDCNRGEALATAVNLESLHLFSFDDPTEYSLSATYPRLISLRLPECLNKESLDGFLAPALKCLIVDFGRASEFLDLVSCKGIPWHQLEEVLIEQFGDIRDVGIAEYCSGVREFLRAIKNVQLLHLHGDVPNALVLKLLTTDCESLYQDHTIILGADQHEIELGRGEDRLATIKELRQCVGEIADGT